MSCADFGAGDNGTPPLNDEVAADVMQLLEVANFNGLCRTIAALAENGLVSAAQLRNIHDCMTTPMDDPDWRDDGFMLSTREVLETVLARAMKDALEGENGYLVEDE